MIRLRTTVGNCKIRIDRRSCQIRLLHQPPREQGLVRAPQLAARGEQQDSCSQPVQPVCRAQLRQVELAAQPYKCRLRDVAPTWHGRQEVRLVDHDDVVVAVQHRNVERHRHLIAQLPIEVDVRARRQRGGFVDHRTVGQDHLSRKHFRRSLVAPPCPELVNHRPAV